MTIRDLFGGDIDAFLAKGIANYGDVSDLLGPQFDRLSDIEMGVMYWLAIEREPIPLESLCEDVVGPAGQPQTIPGGQALVQKRYGRRPRCSTLHVTASSNGACD